MKLKQLLAGVMETDLNIEIAEVVTDSRKVKPGCLFIAYQGVNRDAHDFIPEVIKKGAVAVVGEKDLELEVPYFKVPNGRLAWAQIMANWYDNPQKKLKIIGVTGTDGKTTTSTLIYEILKTAKFKVGLISTVAAYLGNEVLDTGFHVTSPDPNAFFSFLKKAVDKDLEYLVLETTSHALDQERYGNITFEIAVLTNITHEHLDYHKTFENYRDTKLKLFLKSKTSILNKDDPSFDYFKSKISGQAIAYGRTDITITNPKLAGEYNKYNVGAAVAVAQIYNLQLSMIKKVVNNFSGIPGRMEEIKLGQSFRAIVDFAHTPNALEKVLTELKLQKAKGKKLIVVFGCAGLRDHSKRSLMGEIATRLADVVIITAEDPRTESLDEIYKQIGAQGSIREDNRQKAINLAASLAQPGDIVVVTGKGHEKSMCFGQTEYPWSDQEAVKQALEQVSQP